jgi:uncharacterized protein with beta-barrel porin domain
VTSRSIGHPSRNGFGCGLLLVIGLCLATGDASAQCATDADTGVVTCSDDTTAENDGVAVTQADGVTTFDTGDGSVITNTGEIESNGGGSLAVDLGLDAKLVNSGSVRGGTISGPASSAVRARASSKIVNTGTISGQGADSAIGVQLDADARLKNAGVVRALTPAGSAVVVAGGGTEIENSGEIAGGIDGIGVDYAPGGAGGTLHNRKGGSVTSSGNGVAVRGSEMSEAIVNAGRFDDDVVLNGGDDSVSLKPTGEFRGAVDGGPGNDEFILEGSQTGHFDVGSVESFEFLRVAAGSWVLSGEATYANGVQLAGGRTRPAGTLRLTGDLAQRPGADLRFQIAQDGSFDSLHITGAADLDGTVSVRGTPPLADEVEMRLLRATGGVTGDPDIDIPGDTAMLDYALGIREDDILLRVTRDDTYTDFARSKDQRTVAKALDDLFDSRPTGDAAETLSGLDALDADSLQSAFQRIGPEYYDAHSSTALATGQRFTDLLLRRPDVCDFDAAREGDACGERGLEPWATGWGTTARQRESGGHIGFRQSGGGLAMGANVRAGSHVMLAASVGGSRTHIDVRDRGDGSLSQVDLGFAASARAGIARARAAVSYGHGWHDSRRTINVRGIERHAESNHQSDRVGGTIELGAEFAWKALRIEPIGGVDVTYLDEEKFDENGAGSLDLVVASRDTVQVGVAGGVRLSAEIDASRAFRRFSDSGPFVFIPELTAGYRAVVSGDDRDVDARLEDAPSSVEALDIEGQDDKGGAEIGVGFAFQPEGGMTMGLGYGLLVGDDTVGHTGRLSFRMPF